MTERRNAKGADCVIRSARRLVFAPMGAVPRKLKSEVGNARVTCGRWPSAPMNGLNGGKLRAYALTAERARNFGEVSVSSVANCSLRVRYPLQRRGRFVVTERNKQRICTIKFEEILKRQC